MHAVLRRSYFSTRRLSRGIPRLGPVSLVSIEFCLAAGKVREIGSEVDELREYLSGLIESIQLQLFEPRYRVPRGLLAVCAPRSDWIINHHQQDYLVMGSDLKITECFLSFLADEFLRSHKRSEDKRA